MAKRSNLGLYLALGVMAVFGVVGYWIFSQANSVLSETNGEGGVGGAHDQAPAIESEPALSPEQRKQAWQLAQSDFRAFLQMNAASLKLGDSELLKGKVVEFDDRYFYQMDNSLSWADALDFCERFGGQLACLHGKVDLDWVLSELLADHDVVSQFYWVGGYDYRGDSTFGWIDGEEFTVETERLARSAVSGAGVLAVDVENGRLIPATGDLEFSFIIEWRKNQSPAGSLEKQLSRMAKSLAEGVEPQWPVGTIIFEDKKYLCIKESLNWQASRIKAEQYGGQLASVTSAELLERLETSILLTFSDRDEVWLGARMFLGRGWRWEDGSTWSYSPWLGGEPKRVEVDPVALSLAIGNNAEEFKFEPKDPASLATGFLMQVGH